MSEYTEKKEYFHTVEPHGAISTRIQTRVFQDGKEISKTNHRGVTDPDNPCYSEKLKGVMDEAVLNQQKTITAYSNDITDLSHSKNAITEELVVKDALIEKLTLSLEDKDKKIDDLALEVQNKELEIEVLKADK